MKDPGRDEADREDLAEDRTRWARRRTLLAKERTFAAWVRTGLSSIAVGFAAAQLLTEVEPRALVLGASVTLVVVGIMALGFGFWSFRDALREIDDGRGRGIPVWLVGLLTTLLVAAALAGLVLILID